MAEGHVQPCATLDKNALPVDGLFNFFLLFLSMSEPLASNLIGRVMNMRCHVKIKPASLLENRCYLIGSLL